MSRFSVFGMKARPRPKGSSNHHHCQHIAGQERLQQVIGDNTQNVVIIGKVPQFLRYVGCTGADNISRKIARCNPEIHHEPDTGSTDGRQKGVGHSMSKDTSRFLLAAQLGQGGYYRQSNGRHCDELEKAGKNSGNKSK